MEDQIRQTLASLEQEQDLTVLFACESGSRAWGFPSADSDFDVRFIYIRPLSWYLSIDEQKDSMVLPMRQGCLDLSGWDVRKALRLLRKSNASLLEWLHSPIIYQADTLFVEKMSALENDFFSPRRLVHHYLGMAHNAQSTGRDGQEMLAKNLFYILRSLLAARWVIDRQEAPPVTIQELIDVLPEEGEVRQVIDPLLNFKKEASEWATVKVDPSLQRFIKHEMNHCREIARNLVEPVIDTLPLDRLFQSLLHKGE